MFAFQFSSFVIYFNVSGHNLLTLMKYKNGLKFLNYLLITLFYLLHLKKLSELVNN
jgi:hypothetical protein